MIPNKLRFIVIILMIFPLTDANATIWSDTIVKPHNNSGLLLQPFQSVTGAGAAFNPGIGFGFHQEYRWTNNISFCSAIICNRLVYYKTSPDFILTDLEQYPGGIAAEGKAIELEVTSWYIDIPFEMKYSFGSSTKDFRIFVKAAIIEHVFFSQRFQFTEADESTTVSSEKGLNIFIGSVGGTVGIERDAWDKRRWQFYIFGQRNLTPLGAEGQNIANGGIGLVWFW